MPFVDGQFVVRIITDGTLTGDGDIDPLSVVDDLSALDATYTYNANGTLDVATTANGTQTMVYGAGKKLIGIIGTGIYKSKTFTYVGKELTVKDVI